MFYTVLLVILFLVICITVAKVIMYAIEDNNEQNKRSQRRP